MVPIGEVSVIPHAWTISARGGRTPRSCSRAPPSRRRSSAAACSRFQRSGSASSALEHRHPHGRDPGGDRDLLVGQQLEHALGVEPRAGQHQPGTRRRRRCTGRPHALAWNIGTTGRIVSRAEIAWAFGQRGGQRVQHQRPVRVDDALRASGRARRVTHRRGAALVQRRPLASARSPRSATRSRSSPRGPIPSGRRRSRARSRSAERNVSNTSSSDSSTTIARSSASETMKPSSSEAEPRVERVQHRAHQRDREVQLQVLGLVPEQRRDPVAVFDPERRAAPSRAGGRARPHSPSVVRWIEPSGRRETTFRAGRQLLRALHDRGQRQREVVHHQAVGHLWSVMLSSGFDRSLILGADRIRSGATPMAPVRPSDAYPDQSWSGWGDPALRPWSCPSRSASCSPPGSASTRARAARADLVEVELPQPRLAARRGAARWAWSSAAAHVLGDHESRDPPHARQVDARPAPAAVPERQAAAPGPGAAARHPRGGPGPAAGLLGAADRGRPVRRRHLGRRRARARRGRVRRAWWRSTCGG